MSEILYLVRGEARQSSTGEKDNHPIPIDGHFFWRGYTRLGTTVQHSSLSLPPANIPL